MGPHHRSAGCHCGLTDNLLAESYLVAIEHYEWALAHGMKREEIWAALNLGNRVGAVHSRDTIIARYARDWRKMQEHFAIQGKMTP
jgi:hypothetical protein